MKPHIKEQIIALLSMVVIILLIACLVTARRVYTEWQIRKIAGSMGWVSEHENTFPYNILDKLLLFEEENKNEE